MAASYILGNEVGNFKVGDMVIVHNDYRAEIPYIFGKVTNITEAGHSPGNHYIYVDTIFGPFRTEDKYIDGVNRMVPVYDVATHYSISASSTDIYPINQATLGLARRSMQEKKTSDAELAKSQARNAGLIAALEAIGRGTKQA